MPSQSLNIDKAVVQSFEIATDISQRACLLLLGAAATASGNRTTAPQIRAFVDDVIGQPIADGGFYPVLDELVDRDLLGRIPDPHSRATGYRVTQRGRSVVRSVAALFDAALTE
jgi:DNA-binding PadR family transcriptional regulator